MNAELQRIYDETPEALPTSRLEPYRDLILRWHRDGRSYPAICKLLGKLGVPITKEPLRKYVLLRTRKPRVAEPVERPGVAVPLSPVVVPARKRTEAEKAALRMAAKACNHKSTVVHKERKERFVFDEDQPLTNQPKEKTWPQQK